MKRRSLLVACQSVAIAALVLSADATLAQLILHVDDSATGVADGSSWCDAFVFLQDALATADARNNDADPTNDVLEILVAQGAYQPDRESANPLGTRDRTATFGDDPWVRYTGVVAHGLQMIDDIVGVFLQRIIDTGFKVRLRTVIVDTQTAADVQVFEARVPFE